MEDRWLLLMHQIPAKPDYLRVKMKDRTFAAGVDRADVRKGAELLGVELDDHMRNVIAAMRAIADELGISATALERARAARPGSAGGEA